NALDGAEHAALVGLRRVAAAGAGGVRVQIVQQTTAEAVVKPGAGEMFTVLHVGRAAEADLALRVEHAQRVGDGLLLDRRERRRVPDQVAEGGQVDRQCADVRREIRV